MAAPSATAVYGSPQGVLFKIFGHKPSDGWYQGCSADKEDIIYLIFFKGCIRKGAFHGVTCAFNQILNKGFEFSLVSCNVNGGGFLQQTGW